MLLKNFKQDVIEEVMTIIKMEKIPAEPILSLDHTSNIKIIPSTLWPSMDQSVLIQTTSVSSQHSFVEQCWKTSCQYT